MDIAGAREILITARKVAAALRPTTTTPSARLKFCRQLLGGQRVNPALGNFAEILERLDIDQRHYWIGTFYTLLLSGAQRRNQAAYFTPPYLARNVLAALTNAGFDPAHHRVIDPAAGGAAFLSTVAGHMAKAGSSPSNISKRLRGMDIDRGLSQLAEILIAQRLGISIPEGSIVSTANSLQVKLSTKFDVVVANPPYGRVPLSDQKADYWEDVCHPGHINKYALFTKLCLSLAKPGGLVALLLPSSFIGGPLYDRLREYIRGRAEVLLLAEVLDREDVFADVQQDVSVLIARAGKAHTTEQTVTFSACVGGGPLKRITNAKLPVISKDPWILPPCASGFAVGGATLADYGAAVRSGYFVWNREQDRMIQKATRKNDVPLIWAENVNAGRPCIPKAKRRSGCDFVRFKSDSPGIIRTNAIVLQRTTNNSQPRRLVAARVSPKILKQYGGFVSENHTIVITADESRSLMTLELLLNSAAVDKRYRRLSGTASISVTLLRQIDLPIPEDLAFALTKHDDREKAIEAAYDMSAARNAKAVA